MATTITTIKKAKLGEQDIYFDVDGTGSTVAVPTSDGNTRTSKKVNASHIPSTSTARAKNRIGSGTPASSADDVDGHLQEVYDDLAKIGEPDDSTVAVSAGQLIVKSGGITSTQLGSNSVVTAKIADDNVTNAKMAADAVAGSASGASGDNCIEAASISATELAADSVVTAKIQDSAVTNAKIADTTIKAAKMVDVPTHYVIAEDVSSTDTGTAVLSFTTSATINANDLVIANIDSFGTGPSQQIGPVVRSGANAFTITVNANQTAGTTTAHVLILKAVST